MGRNLLGVKPNNVVRQHVRKQISEFETMKREIEEIRESIMYPYTESDENIGGGSAGFISKTTEDKAIKLMSNKQIQHRSNVIRIIESTLAESSDETQKIIELKYFRNKSMSWIAISQSEGVNYSADHCKRIERAFVDRIAEKLGW